MPRCCLSPTHSFGVTSTAGDEADRRIAKKTRELDTERARKAYRRSVQIEALPGETAPARFDLRHIQPMTLNHSALSSVTSNYSSAATTSDFRTICDKRRTL
jgi:hypothetical protein